MKVPFAPTGIEPSAVAGRRYKITCVPGMKPDPDDSAVGLPTTHMALVPDGFKPIDRDCVLDCSDWNTSCAALPSPRRFPLPPRPATCIENASPDATSAVGDAGVLGTTRTSDGTPLTSSNDWPRGSPAAGTFALD